ncbi:unnamed protein product [Symbiodinium sp. CCMP2592]|nr:unnamed protein product [Symbiodinium sp. CCMP2592]
MLRQDLLLPSDDWWNSSRAAFLCLRASKTMLRRRSRIQHIKIEDPKAVALLETVFASLPKGQRLYPLTPAAYRYRWNKLMAALSVPSHARLTPGGLRGGGAVYSYRCGVAIPEIQWRMRLKHVQTLEFYLQEVGAVSALTSLDATCARKVRAAHGATCERELADLRLAPEVGGLIVLGGGASSSQEEPCQAYEWPSEAAAHILGTLQFSVCAQKRKGSGKTIRAEVYTTHTAASSSQEEPWQAYEWPSEAHDDHNVNDHNVTAVAHAEVPSGSTASPFGGLIVLGGGASSSQEEPWQAYEWPSEAAAVNVFDVAEEALEEDRLLAEAIQLSLNEDDDDDGSSQS